MDARARLVTGAEEEGVAAVKLPDSRASREGALGGGGGGGGSMKAPLVGEAEMGDVEEGEGLRVEPEGGDAEEKELDFWIGVAATSAVGGEGDSDMCRFVLHKEEMLVVNKGT
jgi:hypothetical protein